MEGNYGEDYSGVAGSTGEGGTVPRVGNVGKGSAVPSPLVIPAAPEAWSGHGRQALMAPDYSASIPLEVKDLAIMEQKYPMYLLNGTCGHP